MPITRTARSAIALVGLTASLALPIAAHAQDGGDPDRGRPVAQIAAELGVTAEQFRAAFALVMPAPKGQRPTEAQRAANRVALATALGVDPEALDAVMDRHRPEGPGRQWGVAAGAAASTSPTGAGARPPRGAGHAARAKGPSAAQLAARLQLGTATVAAAMKAAHAQVRDVSGRDARTAAFEAAVATQLGLPGETVATAFAQVRADTLTACVDRLVAQGVLGADAAAAIRAAIAAGDLDGAHAAIKAAKAAAGLTRRG